MKSTTDCLGFLHDENQLTLIDAPHRGKRLNILDLSLLESFFFPYDRLSKTLAKQMAISQNPRKDCADLRGAIRSIKEFDGSVFSSEKFRTVLNKVSAGAPKASETFERWNLQGLLGTIATGRKFERETDYLENPFDVMAWYQPLHFYGEDFGIHVDVRAVIDMAVSIARRIDWGLFFLDAERFCSYAGRNGVFVQCLQISLFSLLAHEYYHHLTESYCISLSKSRGDAPWEKYDRLYRSLKRSDDQLEESLANAYAFRSIKALGGKGEWSRAVQEAGVRYLAELFKASPPGYRVADRYFTDRSFAEGERELRFRIRAGKIDHSFANGSDDDQLWKPLFKEKMLDWVMLHRNEKRLLPICPAPHLDHYHWEVLVSDPSFQGLLSSDEICVREWTGTSPRFRKGDRQMFLRKSGSNGWRSLAMAYGLNPGELARDADMVALCHWDF